MTVKNFMWVKEQKVSAYLALGWKQAEQRATRHQIYSTLMEWPFSNDPIHPKEQVGT